jgi:hypothetical protein
MSYEDMKAELEQLRKENAALKKEVASGIRLKVSGKGAVSVYGLSLASARFRVACSVIWRKEIGNPPFDRLMH